MLFATKSIFIYSKLRTFTMYMEGKSLYLNIILHINKVIIIIATFDL